MIHLLWLSGVASVMIWMYGHRALREDDLGTVSAQWLHEYRCENAPKQLTCRGNWSLLAIWAGVALFVQHV